MITTVKELKELMEKKHENYPSKDVGEVLCYYIHEENMAFTELAEHFDLTLYELAEVIADHIRRL